MSATHTDAQIAEAAFFIWQSEGQPEGRSQDHWFRAIETLKAEAPAPKKKATRKAPAKKAAPKAAAKAKTTAKPAAKKKAAAK